MKLFQARGEQHLHPNGFSQPRHQCDQFQEMRLRLNRLFKGNNGNLKFHVLHRRRMFQKKTGSNLKDDMNPDRLLQEQEIQLINPISQSRVGL